MIPPAVPAVPKPSSRTRSAGSASSAAYTADQGAAKEPVTLTKASQELMARSDTMKTILPWLVAAQKAGVKKHGDPSGNTPNTLVDLDIEIPREAARTLGNPTGFMCNTSKRHFTTYDPEVQEFLIQEFVAGKIVTEVFTLFAGEEYEAEYTVNFDTMQQIAEKTKNKRSISWTDETDPVFKAACEATRKAAKLKPTKTSDPKTHAYSDQYSVPTIGKAPAPKKAPSSSPAKAVPKAKAPSPSPSKARSVDPLQRLHSIVDKPKATTRSSSSAAPKASESAPARAASEPAKPKAAESSQAEHRPSRLEALRKRRDQNKDLTPAHFIEKVQETVTMYPTGSSL